VHINNVCAGAGIVDPVQAQVLPRGQGLGVGSKKRVMGEDGEDAGGAAGGDG